MTNPHLLRALGDLSIAMILALAENENDAPTEPTPVIEVKPSWRERLWTVPEDTRLGVPETAEALGRSKSWVYKKASRNAGPTGLPCRKLEGELLFTAGELREWIKCHEEVERTLRGIQRK